MAVDGRSSHHHVVMLDMAMPLENLAKHFEVNVDRLVFNGDIQGVVRRVRSVVYPRHECPTGELFVPLKVIVDFVEVHAAENLEVAFQDPAQ